MSGGTLLVTRAVKNHAFYKERLESLGFLYVNVTAADKDGLNFVIRDIKPDIFIMDVNFYHCSTPYMMGVIRHQFPDLYMAAVSIGEFPADLAMYFVLNGANAYIDAFDGIEQFYIGLENIRKRKDFIPSSLQDRINARKEYPIQARRLTNITTEILRCLCNGFSLNEIADTLAISERTVANHKKEIYRSLNAGNIAELYTAALDIGVVTRDELNIRHRLSTCTPLPDKFGGKIDDSKDEKRERTSG